MTANLAEIERKPAKTINLGLTYGMGKKKLASELGLTMTEANRLFNKYHNALPYIDLLTKKASKLAGERGFVKTLLGRRKHFDMYGPPMGYILSPDQKVRLGFRADDPRAYAKPFKYKEAVEFYGGSVQRWFLHKALNSIIQGSSADMIKVAMVLCRRAGYIPHLTVHDENDYSIRNRKEAKEIHDIMVNDTRDFLQLTVPLKVDVEVGPNWGECELIRV
jgi:DNA polymerase I-like protein with 3'-5' exonuclease and polymerase domains